MRVTGDEPCDVRRVDHQQRAALVGDLSERLEVEETRVGGGPRDDQLGTLGQRRGAELVVVEPFRRAVDAVRDEVEQLPGDVHGRTMGEMTALIEAHPHHLVAGLEDREIGRQVRVGSGVWLHVRMLGAEQLADAVACHLLDLVDHTVAAVPASLRVPLGVLVGEHRSLRGEHRERREVLGRDQLDGGVLPFGLAADQLGDLGIRLLDRAELVAHCSPSSSVISSTRRW